jgi:RHS repeat-associated protein
MRNWLASLANRKSDDSLISSYAYGHDDVGNRTSMTEANGDVTSYTYDDVYRLTDETKRDSGSNVLYRYQYTYDGVGNRLTENNTGEITYTYDANNKLTQLVGPSGTTTFGYDDNGNMTSMTNPGPVVTTYGYDYESRLTSVDCEAGYEAAYTYAADGLRLRVQESNHAHPDRWFQYDGVRPVLEGTLSGDTFGTLNRYVLEGDSYYDPLIFASIGGNNRYYLYDGLGSTRQLLDSNQSTADTYSYEAFGNLMSSSGSTPNPYQYVGSLGYYQTGSSLMHLGARYYMPEVGRFLTRDPLRPTSRAFSGYSYCDSLPTQVVDPSGAQSYPGFDDEWLLQQLIGPQDDPYFAHFPGYAADVLGAFAKCMSDCMDPVRQVIGSGLLYTIGKAIGGRIGGFIAGPAGWGVTGASAGWCFLKCDTMCELEPYLPKRWKKPAPKERR